MLEPKTCRCGKPAWNGKLCNCCILQNIISELKRGENHEIQPGNNENKPKNNKRRGKHS